MTKCAVSDGDCGGMAERSNAVALKATGLTASWVQIPFPPSLFKPRWLNLVKAHAWRACLRKGFWVQIPVSAYQNTQISASVIHIHRTIVIICTQLSISIMTSIEEQTFNNFPLYIPESLAVLFGTVDIKNRDETLAVYYSHVRNVMIGTVTESNLIVPEFTTEEDSRLMGEQARAVRDDIGEHSSVELSTVGKSLYEADKITKTLSMSVEQAYVYTLQEQYGFNQQNAAKIFNISIDEVEEHFNEASKTIDSIEDFDQVVTNVSLTQ